MNQTVRISSPQVTLEGDLTLMRDTQGIILFAHGSGSSRFSPRNQYVANFLQEAGLSTLLFDLLTVKEEALDQRTGHLRFNIELLAQRLSLAKKWVSENEQTGKLSLGYFGASTGAAAALKSAAEYPGDVKAIVSRGGRPDMAGLSLQGVNAPTLLIVGAKDTTVIELNKEAFSKLHGEKQLVIVPGAGHLFEESGALEAVARLAADFFLNHLNTRI